MLIKIFTNDMVIGNMPNKIMKFRFLKKNVPRSVSVPIVGNIEQVVSIFGKISGSDFVRGDVDVCRDKKDDIFNVTICRFYKRKIVFNKKDIRQFLQET